MAQPPPMPIKAAWDTWMCTLTRLQQCTPMPCRLVSEKAGQRLAPQQAGRNHFTTLHGIHNENSTSTLPGSKKMTLYVLDWCQRSVSGEARPPVLPSDTEVTQSMVLVEAKRGGAMCHLHLSQQDSHRGPLGNQIRWGTWTSILPSPNEAVSVFPSLDRDKLEKSS